MGFQCGGEHKVLYKFLEVYLSSVEPFKTVPLFVGGGSFVFFVPCDILDVCYICSLVDSFINWSCNLGISPAEVIIMMRNLINL